jgi:hypothetical protein
MSLQAASDLMTTTRSKPRSSFMRRALIGGGIGDLAGLPGTGPLFTMCC